MKKRLADQGAPLNPMSDFMDYSLPRSNAQTLPAAQQNHTPHRSSSLILRRQGTPETSTLLQGEPSGSNSPYGPPLVPNAVGPTQVPPPTSLPADPRLDRVSPDAAVTANTIPNHRDRLSSTDSDIRTHRDSVSRDYQRPHQKAPPGPTPSARNYYDDYGPERSERFSELLNSTIVSDHFDQYRTHRDDSGLGRELDSPEERERYHHPHKPPHPGAHTDRSPDSGVGDTEEIYRSRTRPLQRRKTLPSIVKREDVLANQPKPIKGYTGEAVQSQQNLNKEDTDTYIIENGIRKRVKAEVYTQPVISAESTSAENIEKPKELPKRYKMESPTPGLRRMKGKKNMGSLPDVSACKELEKKLMPREEVHQLSEKRREELRLLKEEEERRKNQEIVLRLGDMKVSAVQL